MKASDKILDRIRKLLAMSKDTSSPNEAAIAARRARAMMDEYQVSEWDVTKVTENEFGFELVAGRRTNVRWLALLAVAAADLNDCQCRLSRVAGILNFKFEGFLADAVCAAELYKYLVHECDSQASRLTDVTRADRTAYRQGFGSGVQFQVGVILRERKASLKTSTGTSLVLCKQQLVAKHFHPVRYSTSKATATGGRDYFRSGQMAGQNTSLNRQVGGSSQRRLSNG